MGFFLKRLVSEPLPIAILLLGGGLALLWFSRRQRAGRILATVGLGILLLFGVRIVSDALIEGLEEDHRPLPVANKKAGAPQPRWIVVLGSGHVHHPMFPPTAQLVSSALSRLAEAIRLYHAMPGTKLLVCGAPGSPSPHGEVLAKAARDLGVPDQDVVSDVSGWNTLEEARAVVGRLGGEPFILVTSALHMGRALRLFHALGSRPIPAPTDYVGMSPPGLTMDDVFPSPGALGASGRALHEYLGYAWSWLWRDI